MAALGHYFAGLRQFILGKTGEAVLTGPQVYLDDDT